MNKKHFTKKNIVVGIGIVIIMILTIYITNYSEKVDSAYSYIDTGDYSMAYEKIENLSPIGRDKDLFEKIDILKNSSINFESYENARDSNQPDFNLALGELILGYQQCLLYDKDAHRLGISDKLSKIREKYIVESKEYFDLSEGNLVYLNQLISEERESEIDRISTIRQEIYVAEKQKIEKEKEELEHKRNNPIVIEDAKLSRDGNYIYYRGYIKNVSDREYTYIKVKAIYYDISKNVLDTDWTFAVASEGIYPNERKGFEIMTRFTEGITNGNLSIMDYQ